MRLTIECILFQLLVIIGQVGLDFQLYNHGYDLESQGC